MVEMAGNKRQRNTIEKSTGAHDCLLMMLVIDECQRIKRHSDDLYKAPFFFLGKVSLLLLREFFYERERERQRERERERERPGGGDVTYKPGFNTSLALDSEHPSCCLQNSISNNNCSNEY